MRSESRLQPQCMHFSPAWMTPLCTRSPLRSHTRQGKERWAGLPLTQPILGLDLLGPTHLSLTTTLETLLFPGKQTELEVHPLTQVPQLGNGKPWTPSRLLAYQSLSAKPWTTLSSMLLFLEHLLCPGPRDELLRCLQLVHWTPPDPAALLDCSGCCEVKVIAPVHRLVP